jgi:hypothetical protein
MNPIIDEFPTLDKTISDILQKATGSFEQMVNALISQFPDLVRELLTYNLITNLVFIIFDLAVVIFLIIVYRKVDKLTESIPEKIVECDGESLEIRIVVRLLAKLALLIMICGFFSSTKEPLFEVLKITFAPKIYLLEYVSNLMQHH